MDKRRKQVMPRKERKR